MPTDIRLDEGDGNWVVLEGRVLKATTFDFMLDSPERRLPGRRGLRRALVHDPQDGLTINWGNDYPGGVTINDVVALRSSRRKGIVIQDVAELSGIKKSALHAAATGTGQGMSGNDQGQRSLVLRGHIMIEANPTGPSEMAALPPGHSATDVVSLQGTILDLNGKIERLSQQLTQLEKRVTERVERV